MMETNKEVACKTCSKPTTYTGTKLCNNCWEVETRIDEYLESKKGRQLVRSILDKYDDEVIKHE